MGDVANYGWVLRFNKEKNLIRICADDDFLLGTRFSLKKAKLISDFIINTLHNSLSENQTLSLGRQELKWDISDGCFTFTSQSCPIYFEFDVDETCIARCEAMNFAKQLLKMYNKAEMNKRGSEEAKKK